MITVGITQKLTEFSVLDCFRKNISSHFLVLEVESLAPVFNVRSLPLDVRY
jgi:hypothetical protein